MSQGPEGSEDVLPPAGTQLKFVLSPEKVVTPDILGKLPGEAFRLCGGRLALAEAMDKAVFEKHWGETVKVPPHLCEQVENQLKKQCLQLLALAKRSGALVAGFDKVHEKMVSGKARLLIQAADASPEGKGKLAKAASQGRALQVKTYACFDRETLGRVIGREHAVHVAVTEKHFATILEAQFFRYLHFIEH